jgi:hypothetical protein
VGQKRARTFSTLIVCAVFLLLLVFTRSPVLNDTYYYAVDIHATLDTSSPWSNPILWDPGHLLWRPLARLVVPPLLPLLERFVRGDAQMAVTLLLISLSCLAMLCSVLILYSVLVRTTDRPWLSLFVIVAFMCSNASLCALHSGTPYPAGLACILAGIWLVQKDSPTNLKRAALAGLCGGVAVCFWFPYIVALPALLCLAVFNQRSDRVRSGLALTISAAAVVILLLGLGAHFRGVDSFSSFRMWFTGAGHGTEQNRNFIRSLFGLPRAFLDMGQMGIRIKQFLFHDPYANVKFGELFRLSLWKIGLFYTALLGLASLAFFPEGVKPLTALCIALGGNVALALVFEGGSTERYLPLFPFFFIAAGQCLSLKKTPLAARVLVGSLLLLIIVGNLPAFSASRIHAEQNQAADRVTPLLPLPHESRLYTIGEDNVFQLRVNAPLHEVNHLGDYEVTGVYVPMMRTGHWKHDFASGVLSVWEKGGEAWITTRVLQAQPRREWNWVEGDDPKVSWKDIVNFFPTLERGTTVGGEDGFFLLPHSATNRATLASFAN